MCCVQYWLTLAAQKMNISPDAILYICKFLKHFNDVRNISIACKSYFQAITNDGNLFICMYLRDFGIDFWNFSTGKIGANLINKKYEYRKLRDYEKDDLLEIFPFQTATPVAQQLLLKHDYSQQSRVEILKLAAQENQKDISHVFHRYRSWYYSSSNYEPFVKTWKQAEEAFVSLASNANAAANCWYEKCVQERRELKFWRQEECAHIIMICIDEEMGVSFLKKQFSQCYKLLEQHGKTFKFDLALKNGKPSTLIHVCKQPIAYYENYRGAFIDNTIFMLPSSYCSLALDEYEGEKDGSLYKWYHTTLGQARDGNIKSLTLIVNSEPCVAKMQDMWNYLRFHGLYTKTTFFNSVKIVISKCDWYCTVAMKVLLISLSNSFDSSVLTEEGIPFLQRINNDPLFYKQVRDMHQNSYSLERNVSYAVNATKLKHMDALLKDYLEQRNARSYNASYKINNDFEVMYKLDTPI